MMEIPSGRFCWHWCDDEMQLPLPAEERWKCPFLQEGEGGYDHCWNPISELCGVEIRGVKNEQCLAAYPYGGTVEIKPKETH